jgi:hypothetical protein
MTTVIIVSSGMKGTEMANILFGVLGFSSENSNWKYLLPLDTWMSDGVILLNKNRTDSGIYRVIRPGDIIIIKDGKYVY